MHGYLPNKEERVPAKHRREHTGEGLPAKYRRDGRHRWPRRADADGERDTSEKKHTGTAAADARVIHGGRRDFGGDEEGEGEEEEVEVDLVGEVARVVTDRVVGERDCRPQVHLDEQSLGARERREELERRQPIARARGSRRLD